MIAVPKLWFPKLAAANDENLGTYKVSPFGVHWPGLDKDISIKGLLDGRPDQNKETHGFRDLATQQASLNIN